VRATNERRARGVQAGNERRARDVRTGNERRARDVRTATERRARGGVSRNRRLWTATIFLTVAVAGAAIQVRGAVLPTLEGFYGVPAWQLGLVAPAGTVGYLLVMLLVGSSAGRVDTQTVIVVGAFGTAGALLAMGLAPTFLVFLGAMLARGATIGLVRALDRPLLGHFYPDDRGRVYNLYDAVWAVGAAVGPLAVVLGLALGSWRFVYVGLAGAVLVLALLFWRLDAPDVGGTEEPLTRASLATLLRRPEILGMLAALFFVIGVEGSLFTWLPYYAGAQLPDRWAELTLTLLLAAYVPGRLVCGALAERVGYLTLLTVILGLLLPAFAYTFVVAEGLWVLAGVAAIGALVSGVFPTAVAYGTDAAPAYSGPVNGVASATGSVAFATVPAVLGVVIGGSSARSALPLLLVPLAAAFCVVVLARVAEYRRDSRSTGDAVPNSD
jgi:fucose permease